MSASKYPANEGWLTMIFTMKSAELEPIENIKKCVLMGRPDSSVEWGSITQSGKKIKVIHREKKEPAPDPLIKFKTMAEIIAEHQPSAEVLRQWFQHRGIFCDAEFAVREAPLHTPNFTDEEKIIQLIAAEKADPSKTLTVL